jgi:hypothetical protein
VLAVCSKKTGPGFLTLKELYGKNLNMISHKNEK